ncbi:TIR domain-containing protein [Halomonas sp. N3-2A]|uniref:TIR domain-containing protein n=1 Tax=Halomonas sp. N3-2A TaxID=2014541 RepID=UPI0018E03632|nr:nucleotide-binding protein [Halomonas sp. N3-2A]
MAKGQSVNEPKAALELLISPVEAESKLTERIEKGKEILELCPRSHEEFKEAQRQYYKWDDFNVELLKRQFTTDELSEEYSAFVGSFAVSMDGPSLAEEIRDLKDDIENKIHRIESIIERLELIPVSGTLSSSPATESNKQKIDRSKVFIVHGHDNEAKLEVARFVTKIGFEPIIIHEQVSASKTIIEKIEAYSDVGFGVVIYSPCDVGAKSDDAENLKGRARQNVVFEHGFLIGKLGRPNVCPLVKGNVETPNDISGVVYTSMDNENWQLELAKELREAGYTVDMNKVI